MDGHFVPNISFGPAVVRTLRPLTKLFFDVHLMCSKPEILLEPFAQAGASQINIHVELGEAVTPLLWKIKSLGKKVGLAINPPTSIAMVQPYLEQIDSLLIMTVNPGFWRPILHLRNAAQDPTGLCLAARKGPRLQHWRGRRS